MSPELLNALAIFVLAILVGFEVISKVPATLHTPLMSGANSIHGIVMVFFFLVPSIPATLGNFLVPMMIGAKDLAFPKLAFERVVTVPSVQCVSAVAAEERVVPGPSQQQVLAVVADQGIGVLEQIHLGPHPVFGFKRTFDPLYMAMDGGAVPDAVAYAFGPVQKGAATQRMPAPRSSDIGRHQSRTMLSCWRPGVFTASSSSW